MSVEERVRVAIWYDETKSPVEVQRRFHARFGRNKEAPSRCSILRWHENLFTYGNVMHRRSGSGRPRSSGSSESQATVEAAFQQSPERLSVRRAEMELNLSRSAIHRTLQQIGLKAYKIKVLQALIPEDKDRRVQFAEWVLNSITEEPQFLSTLMFSDEAIFQVDGRVNKQNCRIWACENPRSYRERPLHSEKVIVWAAMSHHGVLGPFFFDDTVNGENYLQMLKTFLWPRVANLPDIHRLRFMQDGAPPHFARSVRQWLDQNFGTRWIGRRGPIEWPARSPDMTPLDFYLWGHVKQLVFRRRPRNVDDLRQFIRDAISEINDEPGLMNKVLVAFKHRMHLIVENGGNHIEQLKKADLTSPEELAGAGASEDDAIELPGDEFDDEDVYPDVA